MTNIGGMTNMLYNDNKFKFDSMIHSNYCQVVLSSILDSVLPFTPGSSFTEIFLWGLLKKVQN